MEMKEIEKAATGKFRLPAGILMENAGINVVEAMTVELGPLSSKRVNIFCGQGNNGGDGFVVARHLKSGGAAVRVFFTGEYGKLKEESKMNYDTAAAYGIDIISLRSVEDLRRYESAVMSCDIVVDALIGTGLNRDLEGFMANLVVYINLMNKYTVAVDIPSGIDSDSAAIRMVAVYASLTVTFGLPKIELTLYPGLEYTGKLVVADINFPRELLATPRNSVLMTREIVRPMLPYRRPNANKGSFGPVLIIGGSPGLTGAVVLSVRAALRAGAGLVTAAVPEGLIESVKAGSDEGIAAWLKQNKAGFISADAYPQIMELASKSKVVAIGPGIGRDTETRELIRKLVRDIKKPLVIDADALNALSEDKTCLKNSGKDVILTPHIGEMSRLTGISIEDIIKDKPAVLRSFTREYRVNVILKDGRSMVGDMDGNIYVNTTGNSGMATPGSGDVLTGVVAAFMAHNMESARAGIAANFIHGAAGDMLLEVVSEEGIIAGDIIEYVPRAIKALKKQEA
jgi:NAD(P)H-hydrate epimerase